MNISKKWQKAYYGFVFGYLFFTFIVTIFSLHLFGSFYSFTNISDSMNPSINTGSITIVQKMNQYDYNIGDIISYYRQVNNKEEIITHRIIRIGGNVYITKGDANLGIDAPIVVPRLIIGKVILIIPYLGYLITFAKSAFGLWLIVYIPASSIIFIELSKVLRALREK